MARRSSGLGNLKNSRKVARAIRKDILDYHEGLSFNQVKVILRELGLGDKFKQFSEWISGQTCPIILRHGDTGAVKQVEGVYEYDLFRWIDNQKKGTPLIWD